MTTGFIKHKDIKEYLGVITASLVTGIRFTGDMMAAVKDFTGGRVGSYESALDGAKENALSQLETNAARLGAEAVMGIRFDVAVFSPGGKGTMIGVTVYGTAVRLADRGKGTERAGEAKPFRPAGGAAPGKPHPGLSDLQDGKEWSNVPGTGFEWGK